MLFLTSLLFMAIKPIKPQPGQESVWDYPRPPKLEAVTKHLRVVHQGIQFLDSNQSYRVLETSHPPVYYIPPTDIKMEYFRLVKGRSSFCEFKGMAVYYDLVMGDVIIPQIGWSYPNPSPRFASIKDYIALYASKVDACYVNDEQVQSQQGDFYGGWITQDIVGPFKGGPGTWGW